MDVLVKTLSAFAGGIFFVVWVVAALFTKRSIYHESGLDRLGYIILAVIGWYLLFGGNRLPHPFDFQLIPQTHAILVAVGSRERGERARRAVGSAVLSGLRSVSRPPLTVIGSKLKSALAG